jgi:SAM-dependent methyltransferase
VSYAEPLGARFAAVRRRHFAWYDPLVYRQQPEILDLAPSSPEAIQVLEDLERFSRMTGLARTLLEKVGARLGRLHHDVRRPLRVLDVCAGSAWFSRGLAGWSRARGLPLQLTALDWSDAILERARRLPGGEAITWEVGDATALPWNDGAFDLVVNVQALHHFAPEQVVGVLSEAARVGQSIFFFDLRRTAYGFALVQLFRPLYSRAFIHDGRVSHRRAYSIPEMRFLVEAAGISARVRRFLPVGMLISTGS